MKPVALSCGIAVLLVAGPANAQQHAVAWTDEAIWTTVGETFGFKEELRSVIFKTRAVQDQMRRAGVVPACRTIADFVDRSAVAATEEYRAVIVAEARAVVPEGKTFPERISVHPSGFRFGRLIERVERKAPELFAKVPARIESDLLTDLALLPAIEGEWRGLFADWNFAGPNQAVWSTSCTLSSLSDAAKAKVVFDGFFRERLAQ